MYATVDSMVRRFGRDEMIALTDKLQDTNDVVESVAEQALSDASATIDGYISSRVTLPLRTPPQILEPYCCDIARYMLYDDALDEQHPAFRRYRDAVNWLLQVAKGVVAIGFSVDSTETSSNLAEMQSDSLVFARKSTKGFI